MSSWVERLREFRLINPGFDGDRELGKFLGLIPPNGIVASEKKETVPVLVIDEVTLKMVSYLKHETDEEPDLDAGTS